jgi:arylsulfatase A-like enzyme
VKPFTTLVRASIDNELVDKSIEFMRRQRAAAKPFFLYLPFSMGHAPNLPSPQFKDKSRIGNYGDKMMEGDFHVGQILDTLKELGVEDNTIVVFASDNGPYGQAARAHVWCWALFGPHARSDLCPERAPEWTSADHSEFIGSRLIAFWSEVETGSREENVSKQKSRARF